MADIAAMMADLGNARYDTIAAPDDGKYRISAREERELKREQELRRKRIQESAASGDSHATGIAAWNDTKNFSRDTVAEQQTNFGDGQGHRARISAQVQEQNGVHRSRFENQQDVRQASFDPPRRSHPAPRAAPREHIEPHYVPYSPQPAPTRQRAGSPRAHGTQRFVGGSNRSRAAAEPRTTPQPGDITRNAVAMMQNAVRDAAISNAGRVVAQPARARAGLTAQAPTPTPTPRTQAAQPVSNSNAPTAVPPHLRHKVASSTSSSSPATAAAQVASPPSAPASAITQAALPSPVPTFAVVPATTTQATLPSPVPTTTNVQTTTTPKPMPAVNIRPGFRIEMEVLRCKSRMQTQGGETPEWLEEHSHLRETLDRVRHNMATEIVELARDPQGGAAQAYLQEWQKREWLLNAAVDARSGRNVELTDPIIEEIVKLTEAALIEEGISVTKIVEEDTMTVTMPGQLQAPSTHAENPQLQRADSIISATASEAASSRGFVTTNYLDSNGNSMGTRRFAVDAPVQVAVNITASDPDFDPLAFADTMEKLALTMADASRGLAFTCA